MQYWAGYLDQALIFMIFAVSLNVLLGYIGIFSVGSGAFGAFGGYAFAYFSLNHGWPVIPLLVLSILIGAGAGLFFAWPVIRMSGEYVMLLTMSLSILTVSVVAAIPALGGQQGLLGLPLPSMLGQQLLVPSSFIPWLALAAAVAVAICWRVGESPYGRMLRSIRDDELAAQSLGKRTARAKLLVFSAMCGLTGLAGALLAVYNGIAAPSLFSLDQTMLIFAMVIVGGVASIQGTILGTLIIVFIEPILEKTLNLQPEVSALVRPIFFGLLLVLMMRFRPQGIVREHHRHVASVSVAGLVKSAGSGSQPGSDDDIPAAIEVKDLVKAFGGIRAADHLTLSIPTGKITALVGPNGAGKSTLFNLITGALQPDSGSITRNGVALIGLRPEQVVRHGIARSFQDVRVFGSLSALENVMLAGRQQPGESFMKLFVAPRQVRSGDRAQAGKAMAWLEFVGLGAAATTLAGSLSFAQQKQVSFARALATEADVLLLDEPLSGVEGQAAEEMIALVERIRDLGRTVCIVEHSIQAISRLADWAYFMELGQVTAQGTVSELLGDSRLVEAYFGVS